MSESRVLNRRPRGVAQIGGAIAGTILVAGLLAGCAPAERTSTPSPIWSASSTPELSPADTSVPSQIASSTPFPIGTAIADDGARVVSVEQVTDRIRDLTIDLPAMGRQAMARLVLPVGFDEDPERRWPVLYLLHGAGDPRSYRSWTESMGVDALPAAADAILVSPEGGDMGYYSDWRNGGNGGPPRWATFHLTELRELLQRDWRAGDRMAVMGISMGGFGAISYAGRYPGMFVAAASLSGVLDTSSVTSWFSPQLWGDPVDQADVWASHNPTALVPALAGTRIFVAYGSGEVGPLDPPGSKPDSLERLIAGMNETFVARMREVGRPVTVDAYGPGSHTDPYWKRELDRAMPFVMDALLA